MGAPDRDIAQAKDFIAPPGYRRHRPETTLLYQLVAEHYPAFRDRRAAEGRPLPCYVEAEFDAYLKCGLLEHGFLRVKCDACQAEKLVAFSCKRRGFCPSCGARRMAETAALLVDDVLPQGPERARRYSRCKRYRPSRTRRGRRSPKVRAFRCTRVSRRRRRSVTRSSASRATSRDRRSPPSACR